MAIDKFGDGDDYLDWLGGHPEGYVINILSGHNPNGARVHRSRCSAVNGQPNNGGKWIGQYVKIGADTLAEADQWAIDTVGEPIARCGRCQPPSAAPAAEEHFLIDGPTPHSAVVRAWADDYIRFERRPLWQERLRNEIRTRCRGLETSADEVLYASFFGTKLPNADVENLVLYNIDSFRIPGRNGIRFEYCPDVPAAPDGVGRRFAYRYELAKRTGSVAHWSRGRTLASFDWTDLRDFKSEKQLAQLWLALWRGEPQVFFPAIATDQPFGVQVEVRPPHGRRPVWGGLVKGILDGVISAFQAPGGPVPPEVLERLAKQLGVPIDEIEKYLLNEGRAVLGDRPRLVEPYRSGVKWDPSDHWCVAGEVRAAEPEPGDEHWAIRGEVFELRRKH